MVTFEYKVLHASGTDLEALLNELGREGWRLHTCEPFFIHETIQHPEVQQVQHVVTVDYAVVLDRAHQLPEPASASPNVIDRPEAIACKP
jgi:hypothetical protein